MQRRHRTLRIVMEIDAWPSFSAPPVVLTGMLAVDAARGRLEFPEIVLTELHVGGWENPRPAVRGP